MYIFHIPHGRRLVGFVFLVMSLCLVTGCGRYGSPIAPEEVSPSAVLDLEVLPELQGIHFKWKAPANDQRGKELKFIDGYRIYRKTLERPSDLVDDSVEFEEVAMVDDTHLEVLRSRREEAQAAGKPSRLISVEEDLKKFEFTDVSVQAGGMYAYQIVPVNQGGVEGALAEVIRIVFRGPSSEVIRIPINVIEESPFS